MNASGEALGSTEDKGLSAGASLWFGWVFALTTLTGAFLLFQVQPVICKFILPWFGGGPAVWTTCMLFFQTVLFAGYAYAHFSASTLPTKLQVPLHILLLIAAVLCLPILPRDSWRPTLEGDPVWHIFLLLSICVGLPYLVLASTGPLVQSWFAKAFPGRSPYRLYALSNIGSLVALLSYPFLFEPSLAIKTQSTGWSVVFAIYAILCAACAFCVASSKSTTNLASTSAAQNEEKPSWMRRLSWVMLPAVASLMLLASTNYVCSDVAPMPFLWVVPLSVYLLSFVIAFDHERWYKPVLFGCLTIALILGMSIFPDFSIEIPGILSSLGYSIAVTFLILFLVAMVCHGELVRSRPGPKYLTEFYLSISAGGALGGVFVSLIAPHFFKTYFEWPLALAISIMVAAIVLFKRLNSPALRWGGLLLTALSVGFVLYANTEHEEPLEGARNFYGVIEVWELDKNDPEKARLSMTVEGVTHGLQLTNPAKRHLPLAYYGPGTGVGKTFAQYFKRNQPLCVGAVGLGVGTVATYIRENDKLKIYEINPEVIRLARKDFTFLKDCKGSQEVVLGDARLSLEREAPNQFDILLLDAFSGHSIPTHLLTREAFEIYLRHLKPDGAIAFHITNQFLDLAPIVARLAQVLGLRAGLVSTQTDKPNFMNNTRYMIVSRDPAIFDGMNSTPVNPSNPPAPLWTDGFNDLFSVLAKGRK